ncbi:hypothetical protein Dimus_025769 [Dionaea muscipula]
MKYVGLVWFGFGFGDGHLSINSTITDSYAAKTLHKRCCFHCMCECAYKKNIGRHWHLARTNKNNGTTPPLAAKVASGFPAFDSNHKHKTICPSNQPSYIHPLSPILLS